MRWLAMGAAGLLLIAAAAWLGLKEYLSRPLPIAESGYLLVLEPGMGPARLARRLQRDGLVQRPELLRRFLQISGRDTGLQAGEYRVPAGSSVMDLIDLLEQGQVVQHSFTIPEGWRFAEFRALLAGLEGIRHEITTQDDAALMAALGHAGEHPEGRFFPDTYAYTGADSDLELLQVAYQRMRETLAEEWSARADDLPYDDSYQALIMASIIERETGLASERAQIAGVFVRRLHRGMRLQTDPTVAYGLGADFDGNLTRAHLRTETPYNTYLIEGLPPTPIALPGRESIRAALHPAAGRALYFVARGDGSHEFSETLEQHSAAVKKYQLRRRADYRSSPATNGTVR